MKHHEHYLMIDPISQVLHYKVIPEHTRISLKYWWDRPCWGIFFLPSQILSRWKLAVRFSPVETVERLIMSCPSPTEDDWHSNFNRKPESVHLCVCVCVCVCVCACEEHDKWRIYISVLEQIGRLFRLISVMHAIKRPNLKLQANTLWLSGCWYEKFVHWQQLQIRALRSCGTQSHTN